MAGGLRWTQKDLERHLARSKAAAPIESTAKAKKDPLASLDGKPVKEAKSRTPRVVTAIASLKTASLTGHHKSGEYIEFVIEGATLLSVNDLYGLSHFQRIAYRKAWHELVSNALLLVTRGPRNWVKFQTFRFIAHMRTSRGADNDALNSYFKYAIDGLRYAGLLEDDSPQHMLSVQSSQEKGKKLLRIRIEAIGEVEAEQIRAANLVGAGASSKAMLGVHAVGDPAVTATEQSTRARLEEVAGEN